MIKKVHYCWFGSQIPQNVLANVNEWKRLNPDFEFCLWNEKNVNVSEFEFGRRALAQKRWGYLVDIIRPQKLLSEGGFYLDADIELVRPLRCLESEGDSLILGYMHNCALGTAALYSPPGHPVVAALLEECRHIAPDAWPVSNTVFTDYFINHVPGFHLNGRAWKSEEAKISVHPKEFFEQPAFIRNRGVSIHHCVGSWMQKNTGGEFQIGNTRSVHYIKWLKRKIRTFATLFKSEYRQVYLCALLGRPARKISAWRSDMPQK